MKEHLHSLSRSRLYGGATLAIIGVAVMLTEVALSHWVRQNGISWSTIAVGAIVGYVGFAMLNGRKAREQGQFLVDSTVRIAGTIRSGRRTQVFDGVIEPERRSGEERRADPPVPVDPASLPPEDRG